MSQPRKPQDPFAAREAQNYDNPVPSREFILQHFEQVGEPISYEALCEHLDLSDTDQLEGLRRRLIAMSRDGQLISNRRGVYGLAAHMDLLKGRIQGTKDGGGFFIPEDGSGDLSLNHSEMQKVFDGDIVLARPSGFDRRGRKEGMIVEVLERRCTQLVGRYYWEESFGVVMPDNRRITHEILIPEKENRSAQDGQFVVVEVTKYPGTRQKAIGKVVEILGDSTTPGLEIDIALRSHGIPFEWPSAVNKEMRGFADEVSDADRKNRIDLRHLPFVTIDGEDAKDFDDAVYVEPRPKGMFKLYVAIADVSHYVKVGSALDSEATSRGNSVYFPGHVVPMLPEKISNGLCSLKPDVDRLVMVSEMEIDSDGSLKNAVFYEGLIHSHARLTYNEVADVLGSPDTEMQENLQKKLRNKLTEKHSTLLSDLEALESLYQCLRQARARNGALDFDTTETRIVFGEDRKIKEIIPVYRNDAHRIIEECMLCANVATARFLEKSNLPVLYRIHEGPNPNKLENLREYLNEMGLHLTGGDDPTPKDYHKVMLSIAERPDAHLLQVMIIRSLMQAVYQPENLGHFGLGYPAYTHFTSPIRRYPDLLVHRAIRFIARSESTKPPLSKQIKTSGAPALSRGEIYPYDLASTESLGVSCSATERRADAAGYDVMDWLKCEYMLSKVGDEFLGTITSVTGFGLFVELNDVFVEGLVHITELQNDYYHFDPVRHRLEGERNHKIYQMGDAVSVRIARVSLDDKKIDLQMVGVQGSKNPARKKGKASSKVGKKNEKASANNKGESKKPRKPKKPTAAKKSGSAKKASQNPKEKPKAAATEKPKNKTAANKKPKKNKSSSKWPKNKSG